MHREDARVQAILKWLTETLALDVLDITAASSDASFRRYFRITLPLCTYVVMDAPPDRENIRPFINVASILDAAGVHVPQLFHSELEQGFLVLEDLGSESYLDRLTMSPADVEPLYNQAVDSLFAMQRYSVNTPLDLPVYDRALLTRELTIFTEWFLNAYLALSMPDTVQSFVFDELIASALQQPQLMVHRDFHSRNLMYREHSNPGVIDFQDAVIGPITYDLVSLLKDCYIRWPVSQIDQWRDSYLARLTQAGMISCDHEQFKRWFDLMGLQRHLKAIGIFARLHLRDGKSGYLQDIPRTLSYVSAVCDAYPAFAEFKHFLDTTVLPKHAKLL